MAIITTECIILKSIPYSETSKIINIYTKDHGKVTVMAKGVKRKKGGNSAILEPLNHVTVSYYNKDTRGIQTLSESELVDAYTELKEDLEKIAYSLASIEIINMLVVEEEQNEKLFELIIHFLNEMKVSPSEHYKLYWIYLCKFAEISGFYLNFESCGGCGKEDIPEGRFSLASGRVICGSCSTMDLTESINGESIQVLRRILSRPVEEIKNIKVSNYSVTEISRLLDNYYNYHFDGFRSPESLKLLI